MHLLIKSLCSSEVSLSNVNLWFSLLSPDFIFLEMNFFNSSHFSLSSESRNGSFSSDKIQLILPSISLEIPRITLGLSSGGISDNALGKFF